MWAHVEHRLTAARIQGHLPCMHNMNIRLAYAFFAACSVTLPTNDAATAPVLVPFWQTPNYHVRAHNLSPERFRREARRAPLSDVASNLPPTARPLYSRLLGPSLHKSFHRRLALTGSSGPQAGGMSHLLM